MNFISWDDNKVLIIKKNNQLKGKFYCSMQQQHYVNDSLYISSFLRKNERDADSPQLANRLTLSIKLRALVKSKVALNKNITRTFFFKSSIGNQ